MYVDALVRIYCIYAYADLYMFGIVIIIIIIVIICHMMFCYMAICNAPLTESYSEVLIMCLMSSLTFVVLVSK